MFIGLGDEEGLGFWRCGGSCRETTKWARLGRSVFAGGADIDSGGWRNRGQPLGGLESLLIEVLNRAMLVLQWGEGGCWKWL